MKILKWVAITFFVYVGIVVAFESLIGYFQPANESTLVITTVDDAGAPNDRVLARIDNEGQIYVSANHWPRAWYHQALEYPEVYVALKKEKAEYLAVPVSGEEADRVEQANRHPLLFRIVTGFPPRYFLRLDPR